jgi:esterase/lipase
MRKVIYIIPGFLSYRWLPHYKKIREIFLRRNFVPIFVNIKWIGTTIDDWIAIFEEALRQNHKVNDKIYFFGHSFGAMVSLIVSTKVSPIIQILCSPSAYFKEDLPEISWRYNILRGHKKMQTFKKHSFNKVVQNIKSDTIVLVGEYESARIHKKAQYIANKTRNISLIKVKNAGHHLDYNYINAIRSVIDNL